MSWQAEDHSFVVCAYGESEYLRECLASLRSQRVSTPVAVATSTPNAHIRALAEEFSAPLFVNPAHRGIAGDWNFAISCAATPLVTLAHQDDVYLPDYTQEMLEAMNRVHRPILFHSGYAELRGEQRVSANTLLRVKKVLRTPMALCPGSRLARRMGLALGNSICCPSVTYVREVMEQTPFSEELRCDLDWQEWERLSRRKGSFAFSPRVLMLHRIHPDSETSHTLARSGRREEDYLMFRTFWPRGIARALTKLYGLSERSNTL